MSNIIRTVSFIKEDDSLVKRIEKYQHFKGLGSFIAAVRELCNDALALSEKSKQGK